jgi:pimeloyl-ACP methyl ester carboxylesterase
MSEARIETIRWEDVAIHVDDSGEGDVVVLLHSSGMSGAQWKRTADALARGGARAVVPDLLGSGRSTPWPTDRPFRFLDDVEVIDRLLAKLGRPVHLVGHSYGGLIALQVALRQPERLRSLAVYDPVAFGVLQPERDADAIADLARLGFGWGATEPEREAWLQSFVDYWGGEGSWSRLRDPARAEFARVGWIVHEGARSLVADVSPAGAYAALNAPVLLMTGEKTPLAARRVVAHLGEAIPGARVEQLFGAGHMGPLTHEKKFTDLVTAHVAAARR